MLKKLGFALFYILLGNELQAEQISESQQFIGVEVSITEVQGEAINNLDDRTSEGTSFGIRLGAENEEWRTMFTFNYFDNEERNVEKLFLSIDYFFLKQNIMDSYLIQPYFGVNIGYMNYESVGIDEDGMTYGGQGGLIVNLIEQIDLDLGYRYILSSANALDHTNEIVFGLNYKY